MRKILESFLLCAALLLVSGGKPALALDQQGADALKAEIEGFIRDDIAAMGAGQAANLKQEGEVTVTVDGAFYKLTLPSFIMTTPTREVLTIPPIMANVKPLGDTGYQAAVQIPQGISMKDAQGVQTLSLKIAEQNFNAVLDKTLNQFTKLTLDWGGIALNVKKDGKAATLTLGRLAFNRDYRKVAEGDWDGKEKFILQNLAFSGDANTPVMKLESASGEGNFNRFDLNGWTAILKELQRAMAQNSGENAGSAQMKKLLNDISPAMFGDFASGMTLKGFTMTENASEGAKGFRIANLSYRLGANGLDSSTSTIRLTATYDGATATPLALPYHLAMIPHSGNLDFAVKSLPVSQLWQLAKDAANSEGQALVPSVDERLKTILSGAGTELAISDFKANTSTLALKGKGSFLYQALAKKLLVGSFTLTGTGLDETLAALRAAPDADKASVMQPMMGLGLLQGLGKPLDDAGKTLQWVFGLDAAGKTTVNGMAYPPETPLQQSTP